MENGATTLVNSLAFPQKLNTTLPYDSAIPLTGIYLREMKTYSHKNLYVTVCMHACSIVQSCPTLCDPTDCCPPGCSVHGISQTRVPEQVPFPPPGEFSQPRDQTHVSCGSCSGRQSLNHWATWEALWIFIAAFFITAKEQNQHKCLSTDDWINKIEYIHAMEYYLAMKRNGTSLVVQWLRLQASIAGSAGSIPGQGTKILHAVQHGQIKKK